TRCASSTARAFSSPRAPISSAFALARPASRDPMTTSSPAATRRSASARPKSPVPPTMATLTASPPSPALRYGSADGRTGKPARPEGGTASGASRGDDSERDLGEGAPGGIVDHQRPRYDRAHLEPVEVVRIGLVDDQRVDQ